MRLRRIGDWVGGLSSAGFVLGSYVAVVLVAVLLSGTVSAFAGLALLGILAGYCRLRPTRRGEVFNLAIAPGVASKLATEIFGTAPAWVGGPLALLIVAVLLVEDRRERTAARA